MLMVIPIEADMMPATTGTKATAAVGELVGVVTGASGREGDR
ncbi:MULTISPECIES: hypothetical protein [unclassified Frankia]|nr:MULTISPECIES: hypothetical protein [unclassified Frankia]